MTHYLPILLLFFCPLIVLLMTKGTYMIWYYRLRRWIWHRRLTKKIEKELKARNSNID